MFDYNQLKEKLKKAMEAYNEAVWDWLPPGSSRRIMPEIDIATGFSDDGGGLRESTHIDFRDEFHPFQIDCVSLEEGIEKAIEYIEHFEKYLKEREARAWYVVKPFQGKKFLAPFDMENLKSWRRNESRFFAFPTKEEAEKYVK